jgi:hypothetical protein
LPRTLSATAKNATVRGTMVRPENQKVFDSLGSAERRELKMRAQSRLEQMRISFAAIVTIVVVVGAIILAKWPHMR